LPLTADLAARADYLITMTRSHQHAVAGHFGRAGARPRLLCREGGDVADPIGCDQQVYRDCAQQILRELEGLVPEFQES
jgi:protein-tyrosine-phosphatase